MSIRLQTTHPGKTLSRKNFSQNTDLGISYFNCKKIKAKLKSLKETRGKNITYREAKIEITPNFCL
jgi:hypothetical protein